MRGTRHPQNLVVSLCMVCGGLSRPSTLGTSPGAGGLRDEVAFADPSACSGEAAISARLDASARRPTLLEWRRPGDRHAAHGVGQRRPPS